MKRILAIAIALTFSVGAQAGMFKCKDASGKVAYQDHPCVGAAEAKAINATPASGAGNTAAASDYKAKEAEFSARRQNRLTAEAAKEAAEAKAAQESADRKVQRDQLAELKKLRETVEEIPVITYRPHFVSPSNYRGGRP